jgi:hypothetical protein
MKNHKLELTGFEMAVLHMIMDNLQKVFNDEKSDMVSPETVPAFNSILKKIEAIHETL